MYMRLDTHRDGSHHFPISRLWKEISGVVDAVYNYGDNMYIIQVNSINWLIDRVNTGLRFVISKESLLSFLQFLYFNLFLFYFLHE